MTELQYSAIKALATSPEAYKAFKLSVRNRKGLDQYMNRVWPYYVKKARRELPVYGQKKKLERKLNGIKRYLVNGSYYSSAINIEFDLNEIRALIMMDEDAARSDMLGMNHRINPFCAQNDVLSMIRWSDLDVKISTETFEGSIITSKLNFRSIGLSKMFVIGMIRRLIIEMIKLNPELSIKRMPKSPQKSDIIAALKRAKKDYSIRIWIDTDQWMRRLEEECRGDYYELKEKVFKSIKSMMEIESKYVLNEFKVCKYKKLLTKASQNIGIEIEYSGPYVNVHSKMKAMGAISYECGYDGYHGDRKQNRKNKDSRLRELRLRMNGIYSIEALNHLLKRMKELDCGHSDNSSIHYHIDRRHISKNSKGVVLEEAAVITSGRRQKIQEEKDKWASNDNLLKSIGTIFEYESTNSVANAIEGRVRYSDEFGTLEWRLGSRTLSYSKMILQILTAIHLTNSTRYSNKQFNEEYIVMLAKIAKELY